MINTTLEQHLQIVLTDESIVTERAMLTKVIDLSMKAGFKKDFNTEIRKYAEERLKQIDKLLTA